MSEAQPPSSGARDALDREAAQWFARLRGPDAETLRPEFEAWLARGAEQRAAYNRAAEIFAMGKLLAPADPVQAPPPRRPVRTAALALCALAVVAAGSWGALRIATGPDPAQRLAGAQDSRTWTTLAGETRTIRLADGSTLTLGGTSAVAARFDATGRRLRLLRGQARFAVAHEARPFVVFAGKGSITARGTLFEVILAPAGRVDVRLLEGAIDVAVPGGGRSAPLIRPLHAGERIAFEGGAPGPAPVATPAASPVPSASVALRDYQGIALAALVAEANRNAARPIRLADPALGQRRVSGRFRIDDTALLARRLAALLGGRADVSRDHEILLTR